MPVPDALIRLVRMTFRPHEVDTFLALFDDSSVRIRAFEGCLHLELWRDEDQSNVFTTYSLWRDRESLEHYRRSELFRTTWEKARTIFAAEPEAWSFTRIRQSGDADGVGSQP